MFAHSSSDKIEVYGMSRAYIRVRIEAVVSRSFDPFYRILMAPRDCDEPYPAELSHRIGQIMWKARCKDVVRRSESKQRSNREFASIVL
jgi:hypothetical protein